MSNATLGFNVFIFASIAVAVAAIVTTGILLHRKEARLWTRVFVWAALFLLMPVCFIGALLVLWGLTWSGC